MENISNLNSFNNKHKGNKNNKKNIEYLTSINANKKNQGIINKKLLSSQTKIEFTQRTQYRNSKRSGLTEIISNFDELKINTTDININTKDTKDKNDDNKELRKINYNPQSQIPNSLKIK